MMTKLKADLLIPVYNSPWLIAPLLQSLHGNTNPDLLKHIYIGDDRSDAHTRKVLRESISASGLPIKLIRHDQNLGFGGNCNALMLRSDAPIAIILNTDILLPPNWLERMVATFRHDDSIVLATPLSNHAAENSITYAQGQDWYELDRIFAGNSPSYPDALKAVGFCLGVRADYFDAYSEPLFDVERYPRGYWEDTDLHLRVIHKGLRSVIIDNLYVYHKGSQSFGLIEDALELSSKNEKIFHKRWGELLDTRQRYFMADHPLTQWRSERPFNMRHRQADKELDLLFVLPLPNEPHKHGGVNVIFSLIRHLQQKGFRVGLFAPQETISLNVYRFETFRPWNQLAELYKYVLGARNVIATSRISNKAAQEIAQHYGAPLWHFIQGPEMLFGNVSDALETYEDYQQMQRCIVVSEYLAEYVKALSPATSVSTIPMGPDRGMYFDRADMHKPRKRNSLAVHLHPRPNKAGTMALQFALMAQRLGFELHFFGDTGSHHRALAIYGAQHGYLPPPKLAELFSQTEFFIDCSWFEGLGLLPMEAACCGCIPIITRKGGCDAHLTHGLNALVMDSHADAMRIVKELSQMSAARKKSVRNATLELSKKANLALGCERFTSLFDLPLQNNRGNSYALDESSIVPVFDARAALQQLDDRQRQLARAKARQTAGDDSYAQWRKAFLGAHPIQRHALELRQNALWQEKTHLLTFPEPISSRLDQCEMVGNTVLINGWCHFDQPLAPPDQIGVFYRSALMGIYPVHLQRLDVAQVHKLPFIRVGFSLIASLCELRPDLTQLRLVAFAQDGRRAGLLEGGPSAAAAQAFTALCCVLGPDAPLSITSLELTQGTIISEGKVLLHVVPDALHFSIDNIQQGNTQFHIEGWCLFKETQAPPDFISVFHKGICITMLRPNVSRPDVAKHFDLPLHHLGFQLNLTVNSDDCTNNELIVAALDTTTRRAALMAIA